MSHCAFSVCAFTRNNPAWIWYHIFYKLNVSDVCVLFQNRICIKYISTIVTRIETFQLCVPLRSNLAWSWYHIFCKLFVSDLCVPFHNWICNKCIITIVTRIYTFQENPQQRSFSCRPKLLRAISEEQSLDGQDNPTLQPWQLLRRQSMSRRLSCKVCKLYSSNIKELRKHMIRDQIPLQILFLAGQTMLHMEAVRGQNGGQFPLVNRSYHVCRAIFFLLFCRLRSLGKWKAKANQLQPKQFFSAQVVPHCLHMFYRYTDRWHR